jgi:hypothetical protein
MSNRISDCPPLLSPGEHVLSIEQIRELCIPKFPLSTSRKPIMDGFLKIVGMLEQESISCELLVDGSYLTDEIEPDDIDFTVVVTPEFYENCNAAQRKLLDWIGDDRTIAATHLCECYLCVDYKQEQSGWFEGICDRAWWLDLYRKSVVVKRIRGIAVVIFGSGLSK